MIKRKTAMKIRKTYPVLIVTCWLYFGSLTGKRKEIEKKNAEEETRDSPFWLVFGGVVLNV